MSARSADRESSPTDRPAIGRRAHRDRRSCNRREPRRVRRQTPSRSRPPRPGAPDAGRLPGRGMRSYRSAARISRRRFLPGSSGALYRRFPNAIMAQGKGIREPQFMAAFMHPPTLFKRPGASYPPAREDLTMKLGLSIGYSRRTSGSAGRTRAAGRRAGLRLGLVGRSLWLGRDHAARVPRRHDQPHQARHRHHAAGRAHAGQRRDVGRQHRRDGRRRPLHRRPRCLGTADRRGLVRPAVGQALLPGQGLRRDHAQDLQARRARDARRPRDQPALQGRRLRWPRPSR